jgi:hypothetical protein
MKVGYSFCRTHEQLLARLRDGPASTSRDNRLLIPVHLTLDRYLLR